MRAVWVQGPRGASPAALRLVLAGNRQRRDRLPERDHPGGRHGTGAAARAHWTALFGLGPDSQAASLASSGSNTRDSLCRLLPLLLGRSSPPLQEVMEFNLDDATRVTWDPMLKATWLLGSRNTSACEQLVVWLRRCGVGEPPRPAGTQHAAQASTPLPQQGHRSAAIAAASAPLPPSLPASCICSCTASAASRWVLSAPGCTQSHARCGMAAPTPSTLRRALCRRTPRLHGPLRTAQVGLGGRQQSAA